MLAVVGVSVAWQFVNVALTKLARVVSCEFTVGLSTIHSADSCVEL